MDSVLEISYCVIKGNLLSTNYTVPESNGGGVWVKSRNGIVRFKSCVINDNQCIRGDGHVYGGGAYANGNVEFVLCSIEHNYVYGHDDIPGGNSGGHGGGIYIEKGSVDVLNTIINNNRAEGYGFGGMSQNYGYAYGGGININAGKVSLLNAIITNNTAFGSHGTYGDGLFINSGKPTIENSTFADNALYAIYNNTDTVDIINSIIYFNNSNNAQIFGKYHITYSDVQNGYSGKGNINFNPIFQGNGIYKIVVGSPCIDAGDNAQEYRDECFPPSLGRARNDIGSHGGSQACTWNDCGYTATITPTKAKNVSCNDGKIIVTLFGTLNSVQLKLYDESNNLVKKTNLASCVVSYTFNNIASGDYTLKVIDGNSCQQDYSIQVKCKASSPVLLTSEDDKISSVSDFTVYPNPTKNMVNIKFTQEQNSYCEIILTDISGKRLQEEQVYAWKGGNVYKIYMGNLPKGLYLLRIQTTNGNKIIKLIKE